jgi:hypothetical protein
MEKREDFPFFFHSHARQLAIVFLQSKHTIAAIHIQPSPFAARVVQCSLLMLLLLLPLLMLLHTTPPPRCCRALEAAG